jgi:hypothetical protein
MSLESQIEKLTKAIETLNATLLSTTNSAVKTEQATVVKTEQATVVKTEQLPVVKAEQLPVVEPVVPVKTEQAAPTHADIKDACLALSRKGKKQEAKGLLGSYGAVKAADIPTDKIELVLSKLTTMLEAL